MYELQSYQATHMTKTLFDPIFEVTIDIKEKNIYNY